MVTQDSSGIADERSHLSGALRLGDDRLRIFQKTLRENLGVLYPLLMNAKIGEIRVNANGFIIIKEHGVVGARAHPKRFDEDERKRVALSVLAMHDFKDIPNRQTFDCELPFDGSRMALTGPPTADGWEFTIRKETILRRTLRDFVVAGTLTEGQMLAIMEAIREHKTIVVSGATGAGKTVLLQAILDYLVELVTPGLLERLIIVEHVRELRCEYPDAVQWRTDYGDTMQNLMRHALRNTPDWIIAGEVRDGAAFDYLQGICTGHAGLMSVHANSALHAFTRLTNLSNAGTNGGDSTRLVAEGADFAVHVTRMPDNSRRAKVLRMVSADRSAKGEFITREVTGPTKSLPISLAS